jgi:hypothetical protein
MPKQNSMLLAIWPKGRCPVMEDPWRIAWEDRTPATLSDYNLHRRDTAIERTTRQGATVRYLFPDVVGELRWDPRGGHWSLTGTGIHPIALWIDDPQASDDDLRLAIRALPIEYRVIVRRS